MMIRYFWFHQKSLNHENCIFTHTFKWKSTYDSHICADLLECCDECTLIKCKCSDHVHIACFQLADRSVSKYNTSCVNGSQVEKSLTSIVFSSWWLPKSVCVLSVNSHRVMYTIVALYFVATWHFSSCDIFQVKMNLPC